MKEIILKGEMLSKKNNWRRGRYGNVYLDAKNQARVDEFIWQIKQQKLPKLAGKIKVNVIFKIRRDKDIDNMLGSLFDILTAAEVIIDDRNIIDVEAIKVKQREPETIVKLSLID